MSYCFPLFKATDPITLRTCRFAGVYRQACLRRLKLQPIGLPGKVALSATEGGGLIRVWQNPNRTEQITLPKTWDASAQPDDLYLYIEGVATSAAARDVELKLEYDETPQGDKSGLFKCEDRVKLTAFQVESITFQKPTMVPFWRTVNRNEKCRHCVFSLEIRYKPPSANVAALSGQRDR